MTVIGKIEHMSLDIDRKAPPVESFEQLVALLRAGEKAPEEFAVGTEHEKAPFWGASLAPVAYEEGIKPLFESLAAAGWQPFPDASEPVALKRGGASITLEPGGQLELSGAPLRTLHETAAELREHLELVVPAAQQLDIHFASWGMRPLELADEVAWMPRPRYAKMREYLPTRGRRALDMMLLTCTTQANFDYSSEADMAAKMRCAMGISPVAAALFANSPFYGGQWAGRRSERYATWLHVDPDRCGMLPFVFDAFGYEEYVDYVIDIPMFFILRDGVFHSAEGMTFRHFMERGFRGEPPTLADFETQLSIAFPETRLKTFVEVRAADVGPPEMVLAAVAWWKGILYDGEALEQAWAAVSELAFNERVAMKWAAAQDGLRGHGPGWDLLTLARQLTDIAAAGLRRQDARDKTGRDESIYLSPLHKLLRSGETLADAAIARYGPGPFDARARRDIMQNGAFAA